VTTEPFELNGSNFFIISAFNGEKILGNARLLVESFFNARTVLKAEKWLKVKTEDFQNFRVKVSGNLVFCETIVKEKSKSVKVLKEKKEKKEKNEECPYLVNVVEGCGRSSEPLNEIWRARNVCKERAICLSFQGNGGGEHEEVNLENLGFDELKNMNGEQLKSVVRSLCQEVKSLESLSKKLIDFKETFDSKSSHRRQLQLEAKDELTTISKSFQEATSRYQALQKKRDSLKETLQQKTKSLIDLKKQKDLLDQEHRDWKEQSLYNSLISKSHAHQSHLDSQKTSHFSLLSSSKDQSKSELITFQTEISELKHRLKLTSQEFEETKASNSKLKQKINELHEAIQKNESHHFSIKNSFSNRGSLGISHDDFNNSIKIWLPEAYQSSLEKSKEGKINLASKSSQVLQGLSLSSEISSERTVINRELILNIEANLELIRLSTLQKSSSDLTSLALDISKLKHLYLQSRPATLPDLDRGSCLLSSQSEVIFNEAVKMDAMMDSADQQEEKLDSLKGTMGQVKKQQVLHIPLKSDPVDVALADYVNSNKVPIKFTRQENGNYLFGSTKVYIKLENSKLIVKVKGGSTSIKEFLDIYTNIEVERSSSPKSIKSKASSRPSFLGRSPSLSSKN
jgi:hypothetical protein